MRYAPPMPQDIRYPRPVTVGREDVCHWVSTGLAMRASSAHELLSSGDHLRFQPRSRQPIPNGRSSFPRGHQLFQSLRECCGSLWQRSCCLHSAADAGLQRRCLFASMIWSSVSCFCKLLDFFGRGVVATEVWDEASDKEDEDRSNKHLSHPSSMVCAASNWSKQALLCSSLRLSLRLPSAIKSCIHFGQLETGLAASLPFPLSVKRTGDRLQCHCGAMRCAIGPSQVNYVALCAAQPPLAGPPHPAWRHKCSNETSIHTILREVVSDSNRHDDD